MQIKVDKITKEYNKKLPTYIKVLDEVSVELKEGEAISIIGPTGSGKTTLIEHFNALLIPDAGQINFYDVPKDKKRSRPSKPDRKKYESEELYKQDFQDYLTKLSEWKSTPKKERIEIVYTDINVKKTKSKIKNIKSLRKQVGVVFQFAEYQLFESTIEKDIIFGPVSMGVKKQKAKALAAKYLELVNLPLDYLQRSPFNLSGGQKRRVALAGILAMEPKFLVLDEPTAGLDPQGVEDMLQLFYNLYKNGTTIIIVTHDLDNALRWTNRTIFVKQGKIIRDGNTYDILNDNKFLIENNLIPTKLLSYVEELKQKGFNIGKVTNINELANEINKQIRSKKGAK
ncbi:ATP-binding cassette domain-containing protein [Mycoplasma enhydrae]|uniref:ATP-binding cassette domain-containing protein n=1 Tax=Mycoplasma enhydrae TaxID=2499220 RepID=UPI00197B5230|nr:ATP-binding cassette domain-containing protein [Mycoplasma enhydrae]MBN4089488.1 ATP-binding cassette domain-containing protein [Mycoplasma enhydrae]MCV3733667.1 ATP-binding cassette domain-containing protein [Mycoplasma enhydrae]MCV3753352.1 ATP-binding cassette domain-containing protein [Mycoplasma enhydrae]